MGHAEPHGRAGQACQALGQHTSPAVSVQVPWREIEAGSRALAACAALVPELSTSTAPHPLPLPLAPPLLSLPLRTCGQQDAAAPPWPRQRTGRCVSRRPSTHPLAPAPVPPTPPFPPLNYFCPCTAATRCCCATVGQAAFWAMCALTADARSLSLASLPLARPPPTSSDAHHSPSSPPSFSGATRC